MLRPAPEAAPASPVRIAGDPRGPALRFLPVFVAAAVAVFLPAWLDPAGRWIGPPGDAEQAMWFLGWTPHAVAHGANPLLTTAIGGDGDVNLMWNMLMPLPGLLLAPVEWLFGPVVTYNALITAGVALSGLAMFAALRRHVARDGPAVAGGLLYCLGPFVAAQAAGHPNLTIAFLPPLVLELITRLCRDQGSAVRQGALLGLASAVQLAVWEETLATTAVATAAVGAVLAAQHPQRARSLARRTAVTLASAFAAFAPLAAPLLALQFLGPNPVHGTVQTRGLFLVDLLNPIVPTPLTLLSPSALTDISARFSGNVIENGGYLGLPLLLIGVLAAHRLRADATARAATWSGGVLLVLSLGPSLHVAGRDTGVPLPWRAVQDVPLIGELLPSRLSLFVAMAAAMLVALLGDRVRLGLDPAPRRMTALGALAVLTLVPTIPYPTTAAVVPAFFAGGDADRIPEGSTVLVAPYAQDWTSSVAMLWQARAGYRFRMPEGYYTGPGPGERAMAGPAPTEMSDALRAIAAGQAGPARDAAARERLRGQLAAWHVGTVVVGPMEQRAATVSFLAWVIGRAPSEDGGVEAWWQVGSTGEAS